jgi:hypothetical protein
MWGWAERRKGDDMADDKALATLILDEEMVVNDAPFTGATLIAQYTDGYFALTITSDGACVLGSEGEQSVSIGVHDLLDLVRADREHRLH